MNLIIKGHNLKITPAINEHVLNKFQKITHHFDHLIDGRITLSLEKLEHIAEATIHLPKADIHADATNSDMYHAIELLIQKLDRQVIKYKDKHYSHHQSDGSIKHKSE